MNLMLCLVWHDWLHFD